MRKISLPLLKQFLINSQQLIVWLGSLNHGNSFLSFNYTGGWYIFNPAKSGSSSGIGSSIVFLFSIYKKFSSVIILFGGRTGFFGRFSMPRLDEIHLHELSHEFFYAYYFLKSSWWPSYSSKPRSRLSVLNLRTPSPFFVGFFATKVGSSSRDGG